MEFFILGIILGILITFIAVSIYDSFKDSIIYKIKYNAEKDEYVLITGIYNTLGCNIVYSDKSYDNVYNRYLSIKEKHKRIPKEMR